MTGEKGGMNIVALKPTVNEPLVKSIERLLAMAKQGKIRSMISAVVCTSDNALQTEIVDSQSTWGDRYAHIASLAFLEEKLLRAAGTLPAERPDPEPEAERICVNCQHWSCLPDDPDLLGYCRDPAKPGSPALTTQKDRCDNFEAES